MEICIFYSWQSRYKDNCDKIIRTALDRAIRKLNRDQKEYHYWIRRGGGNVVGSGEITPKIDESLRLEANLIVSDFTHIGQTPVFDKERQKWDSVDLQVNMNVLIETTKGSTYLGLNGNSQVIRVSNAVYGELGVNINVNFDSNQEHFPIMYSYRQENGEDKKVTIEQLMDDLTHAIKKSTEEYIKNRKVKYAPLMPIIYELEKKDYTEPFYSSSKHQDLFKYVKEGKSFRLLGFPGTGKTRSVCQAFLTKVNDASYCDCYDVDVKALTGAIMNLVKYNKYRQTIILDNCHSSLNNSVRRTIDDYDLDCQLITIYYDLREEEDYDVDYIRLELADNEKVIKEIINNVKGIDDGDKKLLEDLAGGFPLMAKKLCKDYEKDHKISEIRIIDLFDRLLNIDPHKVEDIEKRKILTAFAVFKFIGLAGRHVSHGMFIVNNPIITALSNGDENAKFAFLHSVFNEYSHDDILEKAGDMGSMRLIPLVIYLAKQWYKHQDVSTINELIKQISELTDEGTKNLLIESLSRRVALLADVPLAQDLINGLFGYNSPFLSEEVVLNKLGSRLFLGFSEVNPEACANALWKIIRRKNDDEIREIGESRRNLAWALDHLAFDHRSFRNAMLALARFSLVETEGHLSNNTTGLFVERFPVLLPATETPLMERIEVLKELAMDERYRNLIKKALLMALNINHDYRSGGAEKQGLKSLTDYIPETYDEIYEYYSICLDMLLENAQNDEDFDGICKTVAQCARGYYHRMVEKFLLRALEILVPKKNYVWEEMRDALTYIVKYDGQKRGNWKIDEIEYWRQKLTKDDYVYRLEHASKRLDMEYDLSFDKEIEMINQTYEKLAYELIDNKLYEDKKLLAAVMRSKTSYLNRYGLALSEYAKDKGIQEALLKDILSIALKEDVTKDGESLFYYYVWKIEDNELIKWVYNRILHSQKKRLIIAIYAIKGEREERLEQLFNLLDMGDVKIDDFNIYYFFMPVGEFYVKYVSKRLLDYGDEGAALVMSRCRHLLYDEEPNDIDYQEIARYLLLRLGLKGAMMDDFQYMECVKKYLERNRDEELALHIQAITEEALKDVGTRENYYLGRLYRQVLLSYKDLLKHRVFELMEDDKATRQWVSLMRASFPQEKGEGDSMYTIITDDEWFEWLESGGDTEGKAFTLAMMFSYSIGGGKANPVMVRLLDKYYSQTVICGLSTRFHSFGWTGTGIPLYRERIAICKDYAVKLQNEEAKQWFMKDIPMWEEHIQEELLRNAHERAIYYNY